ncbi:MAG: sugar ABC transporter permease, partial [Elusimicrobia bacterium]|nr:sugar ABC transporter permease [Elusimicrobiota bacterium]
VMAMAWRWIFNADSGVMGDLVFRLGLSASPQVPWLADATSAFWAIVLADVWKTTPFMAVLLMSGLAAIPDELYEAAAIDGAGPARRFFIVTLPLLKPTIIVAVIFRAIQTFGLFDHVIVLTGGGPGGRTQTIAVYAYDVVFRYQELAYGCALVVAMALCLVLMTGVMLGVSRGRGAR